MSTELATIIGGALSLIGTLAGSFSGMKLMSYRIEQLERKVDKQADIAERVPIIEEQMKVVNHRLSDTERLIEGLRDKGA